MGSNVIDNYDQALNPLYQCKNISRDLIDDLWLVLYKLHQQKRFSEPMPAIGMYIAVASLFCTLAMMLDMLHSLRNKQMWVPCKYFTLNAASLTVIAVAVKLPMDLTNPMPGDRDREAKLGSMVFMYIMMAYLLPSIATMNRKELVTNIIALGVLVITLVVNVCIQINTGLVSYYEDKHIMKDHMDGHRKHWFDLALALDNRTIAITYVAMLLMLLMIYICSALMILKSKQDLESKYQAAHKRDLIVQQQDGQLIVETLKQRVINYGIMATTGSPQLMTVCTATSSASAVIGLSILILLGFYERKHKAYDSDYKWSTSVIFNIESIGNSLGSFTLLCRFVTPTNFWRSTKGIWKLIKFYEVESCWTHTLSEWKHNRLYSSSSPNFKFVFYKLQILGLTLLTLSQKAIVITCKAIRIMLLTLACISGFLPSFVLLFVFRLLPLFGIQLPRQPLQPVPNRDIRQYALQSQDHMEVSDMTLNFIIGSVERSIQNAEKQQPSKLMKLLENFGEFEGVKEFDSQLVQSLPGLDYPDCWSLPVVTLATIALSLRNIQPSTLKNFLNGVSEGLVYVKLVEKSLNNNDELVSVQKAAERLWPEVEVYHKWLGNNLQDPDFRVKTAKQIVEWFNEKATNMVPVVESMGICANSMYRITKTIMLSYQANNDQVSQEVLFAQLSSMISGIVAACLTNLPEVITVKCHTSEIEKREESVHAAATLLGKTSVIINTLQARELPSLNPEDFPFIDKWRDHLTAPAP